MPVYIGTNWTFARKEGFKSIAMVHCLLTDFG